MVHLISTLFYLSWRCKFYKSNCFVCEGSYEHWTLQKISSVEKKICHQWPQTLTKITTFKFTFQIKMSNFKQTIQSLAHYLAIKSIVISFRFYFNTSQISHSLPDPSWHYDNKGDNIFIISQTYAWSSSIHVFLK